ncbi:uncharacterized protein ACLA_064070 [Aspergillus clavatus NRRL 1]|uniref:TLC domain-containing protein n=1 Tax=Aspergillus clavatus (strain ATCC 1007 / CBS 513.65 / DSM 816 / NCTC 3887 / NRRL 1 / QM 1276 / 107) TaxID=344612 RepID=A1CD29_ASPCL|nr:uncharacterized protein ACLA_064070 [Aspergillus clavatus NRRL 1]EAW12436.1 conserved hypothetical protein [Aspergillus clavatus NRRL 1]
MSPTLVSRHDHTRLQDFPLQPISELVPFSALIISVVLVVLFLIRFYILEGFLIKKLYGPIYTNLDELNRRGFINHHIAGVTKIVILIVAAYPFVVVTFGNATFNTAYAHGSAATMGDVMVVVAQMLIAMYLFELIYRVKLSPIAVLHHMGTILIGQSALAISLRLAREPDADIEFILCTVWGAFDIISEFFPHIAIIIYRVFPNRHHFLSRVFLLSCITTATGTTCETIVTMWLFGSLWDRWELSFKIATPLLHVAFSAAQIHGSVVFWRMYKRQRRLIKEVSLQDEERMILGQDLEMAVTVRSKPAAHSDTTEVSAP